MVVFTQTITVLYLNRNQIDDNGAQYLAYALHTNPVSQVLY
jgi:hypothetical protein